jgi:hypothetical protein
MCTCSTWDHTNPPGRSRIPRLFLPHGFAVGARFDSALRWRIWASGFSFRASEAFAWQKPDSRSPKPPFPDPDSVKFMIPLPRADLRGKPEGEDTSLKMSLFPEQNRFRGDMQGISSSST